MKTTIQIILRATPGVYSSYHQSLQYATGIPFNARDINASITVIDAMFEPFDQYKTKDDVIDMMSKEIFFDRRDAKLFEWSKKTLNTFFLMKNSEIFLDSAVQASHPYHCL